MEMSGDLVTPLLPSEVVFASMYAVLLERSEQRRSIVVVHGGICPNESRVLIRWYFN